MNRAPFPAVLLLSLLCIPLRAQPSDAEAAELERSLQTGIWNERIWAVNRLGERGLFALPLLAKALEDLDWQVRLGAVQWIGRAGPRGASTLEGALLRERCPLVRMAAANWLGRYGRWKGEQIPDNKSECRAWTWPMTRRFRKARGRRSKIEESSVPDRQGCRYIRYRRRGRMACPEGTILKGVGASPFSVEMLEGRPPESGVILCCPPDASPEVPRAAAAPRGVECRTLPTECPPPWVEMEPKDGGWFRKKKPRKFRRTRRMKDGATVWVHCCMPHGLSRPEREESVSAPPPPPEEAAVPFEPRERERAPEGFPEGEIAKGYFDRQDEQEALLGEFMEGPEATEAEEDEVPVEPEDRMAELEHLLEIPEQPASREPRRSLETLPAPRGPEFRTELPVRGDARPHEAPARERPRPALETAPGLEGGPERLAGPEGPGYRGRLEVRAPLELVEDRGAPEPEYDALPALLKMIRSKSPKRRARAAMAIGDFGTKAAQAAPALKKALKDRDARVRSNAALALGRVTRGTDAGLKALRRALRDKHPDVRYSAAAALGRVDTPASRREFSRHVRGAAKRLLSPD